MDLANLYLHLAFSPLPLALIVASVLSTVGIFARKNGPPRRRRLWLLLCPATWLIELLLCEMFQGARPGHEQALFAIALINWTALLLPLALAALIPRLRITALAFGYLNAAICWLLLLFLTMIINDVWL